MIKRIHALPLSAVLLASAALPAFAQEASAGTTDTPPGFAQLDLDGDGRLTESEAAADSTLAADFARADRNGDGQLSQIEFQTHQQGASPTAPVPEADKAVPFEPKPEEDPTR